MLILLAAITLNANFEGGSLGTPVRVAENHFRCPVVGEKDQDGRNRQATWYYFRVDGARGVDLTLDMVDLPGEYNYKPNNGAITGDTPPWMSNDGDNWRPVESVEYIKDQPLLRLRVRPERDRLWIAHVPPYTDVHLQRLLVAAKSPFLRREEVAKSPQGRPITLLTITDPKTADEGKKVVWMMFRQHSWEAGSSWTGDGAIRYLLSREAGAIRARTIFKIFPMCDPDGVARGGVRFNANGYDLNRNWDTADERKTPEIFAQRSAIFRWLDSGKPIHLFLTVHNTETAEYVDGPPAGAAGDLLKRFSDALAQTKGFAASRPASSSAASTTPGRPGRMTVNQGLWAQRQIPAFLMEQRVARHPKLGRLPSPADRQRFGSELVQVLDSVVHSQ